MSERAPETHSQHGPEQASELVEAGREQLAKLEHNAEKPSEHGERKSEQVEQARHTIETQTQPEPDARKAESGKAPQATKFDIEQNYKFTMRSLQRTMTPVARTFSKVIHNPVVDQVSEVAGKTVFRPSISLGATTAAALLGGFVYFVARSSGFELAGSEFWLALVIGGIIGLILEVGYKALRGGSRYFRH